MINRIRRALIAAITPPAPIIPPYSDDALANALGLVRVETYTRRPPVNAKRESLHEQLRAEMGR